MTDDPVLMRVIKRLNEEFGSDIKNLPKCVELAKKLEEDKDNIEKEIHKMSIEASSAETVYEIENLTHTIDEFKKEFKNLCEMAKEKDNSNDKTLQEVQLKILQIQEVEQCLSYLRCIRSIQDLSSNMEMCLTSRSESDALTEFGILCQMCARLNSSKCDHLRNYLSDTLHHWHNVLKERFSLQLDEAMKAVGWPIVNSTSLVTPTPETISKFQLVIKYLFNIQFPPELSPPPAVTSALLVNFPPLSLPMTLLVKPLRKRFAFHFCGSKQTNRPDKPEWFFTQISAWLREHEHALTVWVQPVYNQTNRTKLSSKTEFTQGMVQIVIDKLHSDLPTFMFDDTLFSHTIDEILAFDRELRDSYDYPEALPSAVTVLTQAHVFVKWIHIERKYARDKMDNILSSETAWTEVSGSEDLKATEAAESFLTLLSTMTDRYNPLPQPGHRLQFVELQLELVDELRVRLLQLLHSERQEPLESHLPAILNTVVYISTALREWGTSPHFLVLQHYRSQLEAAGSELSLTESTVLKQATVFDQSLTLLQHLSSQLVDTLCEAVMMEVKARSRPYRRDKWFAMPVEDTLTPSAVPMFQVLMSKLQILQSLLAAPLFTTAWQSIATQLSTFLLEELVLQNRFNEGGAKQLEQDLTRSLIPLFYQYTQRPEAYFLPLKEACALLNVHPTPVEWTRGQYDKLPVQVHHISPDIVRSVIQRRADIIPDLM